jgi:hypothetical protein
MSSTMRPIVGSDEALTGGGGGGGGDGAFETVVARHLDGARRLARFLSTRR